MSIFDQNNSNNFDQNNFDQNKVHENIEKNIRDIDELGYIRNNDKKYKIICMGDNKEGHFFEISQTELSRSGFLVNFISFNSIGSIESEENDVISLSIDFYNAFYKIYITNEDLCSDDYDFLLYTPYEFDFATNRNIIHNFTEWIYKPFQKDRFDQKNIIHPKNTEIKWDCDKKLFTRLLSIIEKVLGSIVDNREKNNINGEFILAGEASLRRCCNYPSGWGDTSEIEIHLMNCGEIRADQIIHLIEFEYPGQKVRVHKKYISYGIIRVYKKNHISYNSILNLYDVDCLSILYSFSINRYFCTHQCKYALENGFNTLWIVDKPKDGYENRNLESLQFGFGLRIPNYEKFTNQFIPDIHAYSDRTLFGSEYIYYYILTNQIKEYSWEYSLRDIWDLNDWFSTVIILPKPEIINLDSIKDPEPRRVSKDFSYREILESFPIRNRSESSDSDNEKEKGKILISSPLIIEAPFEEFSPIESFQDGFSSSPKSTSTKSLSFQYNIELCFKHLVKLFPVIVTGGMVSQMLTIESTFPYTIHLLKDKIFGRSIDILVSDIHQYILNSFESSIFKEEKYTIKYFCKYILILDLLPKTIEESLDSESFDFCRVGYWKEGFITDSIGQVSLSKRIHFSSEDIHLPFDIENIGFRSIVSKEFIHNKILRKDVY